LHAASVEFGACGYLGGVEVAEGRDDESVPGVDGGVAVGVEDLGCVVDEAGRGCFESVGFFAYVGDLGRNDGAAVEEADCLSSAGLAVGVEALGFGVAPLPG
jgi:hypothetical protein